MFLISAISKLFSKYNSIFFVSCILKSKLNPSVNVIANPAIIIMARIIMAIFCFFVISFIISLPPIC